LSMGGSPDMICRSYTKWYRVLTRSHLKGPRLLAIGPKIMSNGHWCYTPGTWYLPGRKWNDVLVHNMYNYPYLLC